LPGIVKVFYLSDLSHHMYFLLSLFVVRIGTLGIGHLIAGSSWMWSLAWAAYIGLFAWMDVKRWFFDGADPLLLALWGLQFFVLGVMLRKWHALIQPRSFWAGPLCLAITAGLWMTAPKSLSFLTQLFYLLGTYALIAGVAGRTKWEFSLGRDTMGIYLLHAPYVLWAVVAAVSWARPMNEMAAVVLAILLSLLLSWGLTRLIRASGVGRIMLGQLSTRMARMEAS